MSDHVEIRVAFPDPVTGRGMAVNALDLRVLNINDKEVGAFTIDQVTRVDSLLLGVVYTLEFPVDDPAVTPGTCIRSFATGTIGTITTSPILQTHWFEPQVADKTTGVILKWSPLDIPDPNQGTKYNVLYYEAERLDLRKVGLTTKTQFVADSRSVGFWTFNGNLDDDSATPADFTAVGVTGYTTGIIDYAAEFQGIGYLSAGNPSKFQFGAGQDFSISLWVQPSPYPVNLLPVVFGKYLDSTQKGYAILLDINPPAGWTHVVAYLGGYYTQHFVSSDTSITNAWHHVVFAVDRDGEASLYIDGVKDLSFDASQNVNDVYDLYNVTVGAKSDGTDLFKGAVDELIVFDGCLTPMDVEKLYNDELGRPNIELVGRTEYTQLLDTGVPPNDLQYYQWRVFQVSTNGNTSTRTCVATLYPKDVFYEDAPLCLVEGRVRLPTDVYPAAATAKFLVMPWDRGQIAHDRILDREETEVPINSSGRFGAYLIQDAVVVCHIPDAHVKWRFAVPRKDRASLQEMTVQKLKFRNNL